MNMIRRISRAKAVAGVAALALVAASFLGAKDANAAQPDLSIPAITINPPARTVTVRIHNDLAPTETGFYVTTWVCSATTCIPTYQYQQAMAAGQDALKTVNLFPGARSVVSCADIYGPTALRLVRESNENNNCRTTWFAPIP